MIKKILSNAMLSIFMDKSAKKKFYAVRESRKTKNNSANIPPVIDTKKLVTSKTVVHTQNIIRQTLVKNAVAVHKEYSKIFDHLGEDQKQKLKLLAMHAMLGNSKKSDEAQSKNTNIPPVIGTKAPKASVALAHTQRIKRQTLIKNAIAAHKKHSKALDNLSEDQKQRLQLLAMHTLCGKVNK
jgi:outer membrane PBP1 activator LpoA protein